MSVIAVKIQLSSPSGVLRSVCKLLEGWWLMVGGSYASLLMEGEEDGRALVKFLVGE